MSRKSLIYLLVVIGGAVGGWLPTVFGAGWLSYWSIIGSTLGGLVGIYLGYKISS